MSTSLVDSVIATVRASRRIALVLAAVALSSGPLGGVAHAKGWGAHQTQIVSPVRVSGVPSHPVQGHSMMMMSPHLGPFGASKRIGPFRAHGSAPVRSAWVRTPHESLAELERPRPAMVAHVEPIELSRVAFRGGIGAPGAAMERSERANSSMPERFASRGYPMLSPKAPVRVHPSAHPSVAMASASPVRWPVAAGAHPVPAGTLGPNAPLSRGVREQHLPVLEMLIRSRHGRR
jgi:hypothetical protein